VTQESLIDLSITLRRLLLLISLNYLRLAIVVISGFLVVRGVARVFLH
jgi:hypothetical protein